MDMSFENHGIFAQPETGHGLRPMTWHGLCARIAAGQDLRRLMAQTQINDEAISTGSFHSRAARIIASEFSGVPAHRANIEGIVNPNSSMNGKADLTDLPEQASGVRPGRAEARD